jgi:uncharacterized protein YjiS (DUF1127 family)
MTFVVHQGSLRAIATGLARRAERARVWRREYDHVRAELLTYSERELAADLGLSRSAIGDLAVEAADERVAAFDRTHCRHP